MPAESEQDIDTDRRAARRRLVLRGGRLVEIDDAPPMETR